MRTLKTLFVMVIAVVTLVPAVANAKSPMRDQYAAPLVRNNRVFLFAETMMRGQTKDETMMTAALQAAQDELLVQRTSDRLVLDVANLGGIFLTSGMSRCDSSEALAVCMARLPIKVYLEAKLTGRILQVDRYQYRDDGNPDSKRFEVILNYDESGALKQQAKQILLCHVYADEFDPLLVSEACSALEKPVLEAWTKPEPASVRAPEHSAAATQVVAPNAGAATTAVPKSSEEAKSVQPSKSSTFPIGLVATIALALFGTPTAVIGFVGGVFTVGYLAVAMTLWRRLDSEAANRGLTANSRYRADLANRRNVDLQAGMMSLLISGMLFVSGVGLMGVVGVIVLYNAM